MKLRETLYPLARRDSERRPVLEQKSQDLGEPVALASVHGLEAACCGHARTADLCRWRLLAEAARAHLLDGIMDLSGIHARELESLTQHNLVHALHDA